MDHAVGLPWGGDWMPVLCSDWEEFGGSNLGFRQAVKAEETPWNGRQWSARLEVPPLGVVILRSTRPPEPKKPGKTKVNKTEKEAAPVES